METKTQFKVYKYMYVIVILSSLVVTLLLSLYTNQTLAQEKSLDFLEDYRKNDKLYISDILEDLRECSLPCFLGFKRNKTSISDVVKYLSINNFLKLWETSPEKEFYSTLQSYIDSSGTFLFWFFGNYSNVPGYIQVSFSSNNQNLITGINATFSGELDWLKGIEWVDLPTILKNTSSTPKIYWSPLSTTPEFIVFVIYQDINVLIVYEFDLSRNSNLYGTQYCFGIENTDRIEVLILDDKHAAHEIGNEERWAEWEYQNFEDTFDMTIGQFIEKVNSNPNNCLE